MAIVFCAVVGLLFSGCTKTRPVDNSPLVREVPLQKGSAPMSLAQLDKLMHENFVTVTDVRKIPESVKRSFCNIEKCNFVGVKFDMVNPSEAMSTDYIMPGVPNKRLRFAALNGDSAIVFYEWGGFVGQLCVTVFDFRNRRSWGASLKIFRVNTLEQLRTAISDRQFTQWSPGDRQ
jgi:hypothetical protein